MGDPHPVEKLAHALRHHAASRGGAQGATLARSKIERFARALKLGAAEDDGE